MHALNKQGKVESTKMNIKKAEYLQLNVSTTKIKNIAIHSDFLWNCYMNPVFSDVVLVIEGKEFYASRIILAMQSTYFEALFNGNIEEGQQEKITLEDLNADHFETILHYMYTGDINIKATESDYVLELLKTAHFLGVHVVVKAIANFIQIGHYKADVVSYLNIASLYDLKDLQKFLMCKVEENAQHFIMSEIFNTFNEHAVLVILQSNKLPIAEYNLLTVLEKWLKINPNLTIKEELLSKIRLSLIDTQTLIKNVAPMQLYTEKQLLNAIQLKSAEGFDCYRYHPDFKKEVIILKCSTQPFVDRIVWEVTLVSQSLLQVIGRVELQSNINYTRTPYLGFSLESQTVSGSDKNGIYVFCFEPLKTNIFYIRTPLLQQIYNGYQSQQNCHFTLKVY